MTVNGSAVSNEQIAAWLRETGALLESQGAKRQHPLSVIPLAGAIEAHERSAPEAYPSRISIRGVSLMGLRSVKTTGQRWSASASASRIFSAGAGLTT